MNDLPLFRRTGGECSMEFQLLDANTSAGFDTAPFQKF